MLVPSVQLIMNIWMSGRWLLLLLLLLLLLMLCISIYALSDFVSSNLIGSLPWSRSNIECYSVPDDLTMVDLQKKNLHFKMSIKLNLNSFLLQNFMLRLSVDEITLWVCTKTIFIVILFSVCEWLQNFNLDLRREKTIIETLYWNRDLL